MKMIVAVSTFLLALSASAQKLQLQPNNIQEIVSAMTTEEKIDLIVGCGAGWGNPDAKFPGTAGWTFAIPRLGIPSVYFADSPAGVVMDREREYDTADYSNTFFLSSSTLATSWDIEAAEQIGAAIGEELRDRGLDIILGPGINLHRNILCGRNQEYFSEDPLLSGKMGGAWIRGAQSAGVGTSLKHFAANNQETRRKENDSRVGERALRELYLKAFEIAVKEGNPWTVMGAYNYVNGIHACENPWLLTDILRGEWGWNGVVMSDWDGVVKQADALKAGCELIEPGTEADKKALQEALADGSLSMEVLDRSVSRILELVVRCPSFKGYAYSNNIHREEHRALLRRIAAESMVLLKNDGGALPLTPGKVALYGIASYDLIPGNMGVNGVNHGAYQVSLVQGLREAGFDICKSVLREYTGYIAAEKERISSAYPAIYKQFYRYEAPAEIIPGEKKAGGKVASGAMTVDLGIKQAAAGKILSLAQQADLNEAAIITLSRATGEAFDRTEAEFYLTESEKNLIEKVSAAYHAAGKRVIVLQNVPAPIEVASWRSLVDAILLVGQPGERAGESIADALTGAVPPSGRLADTWPIRYGDSPSDAHFPSDYGQNVAALFAGRGSRDGELTPNVDYTDYAEGIYVGYRYFTTFKKDVAYPFGHGLSYTSFAYEDASMERFRDGFVAKVTVRNTGSAPGREVVQLYVSAPSSGLEKPAAELKGFAKTRELAPGEAETVEIPISLYDLASWNEKNSRWETAKGKYLILFGCSSSDTIVTEHFRLSKASYRP